MRHYKKGRKLGTDASHTAAIKKNLAVALFTNDRIKTTVPRAKEVRGTVDRIITWAKKGDLHSRRLAIAALGDKELVREVFEKAEQGMWEDRNGGYTRILKLGPRKGDNAPMAILELVEEAVVPKGKDEAKDDSKAKKTTKKSSAKKPAKKMDASKQDDGAEDIDDFDEIAEDAGAKSADDVEQFSEGEEDRVDSIAETDVREDAVESEKAADEETVEQEILDREKAKVEKAEEENIEKIKEDVAREEKELIDDVNPVAQDEADFEEAVEETEKHEA